MLSLTETEDKPLNARDLRELADNKTLAELLDRRLRDVFLSWLAERSPEGREALHAEANAILGIKELIYAEASAITVGDV